VLSLLKNVLLCVSWGLMLGLKAARIRSCTEQALNLFATVSCVVSLEKVLLCVSWGLMLGIKAAGIRSCTEQALNLFTQLVVSSLLKNVLLCVSGWGLMLALKAARIRSCTEQALNLFAAVSCAVPPETHVAVCQLGVDARARSCQDQILY